MPGAAQTSEAQQFAADFARVWKDPEPERFLEVFQPEIRLQAPLTPVTHGMDQALASFRKLLELIPDIQGTVHRWGATEDGVLIEFTLSGTVGGRTLSWNAVDRFVLRGGKAVERISYFDSLPVLAQGARNPRAWPALLKSGIRPRSSG